MTKYFGVSPRRGKYRARITVHGKTFSLGTYETAQDAAIEYDNAVRRLRGPNAKKLNFPGLKVVTKRPKGTKKPKLSLQEPIWVSSDGRQTPISLLAKNHLLNIERILRNEGARIPAEGSREHWYDIILNEVKRRNLEPLDGYLPPATETVETPDVVYTVGTDSQRKPLTPQGVDERKEKRARIVRDRVAKGQIRARLSEG